MDKKTQKIMFENTGDDRETPQEFYEKLNNEFHFTLDPCATYENRKCEKYYAIEDDGLSKDWGGECSFVNPPYSKALKWVEKSCREGKKYGTVVVMLLASRTDTKFFHNIIMKHATEIRFVKGRLKFNGAKNTAPFPSMVVVFDGNAPDRGCPLISTMERK